MLALDASIQGYKHGPRSMTLDPRVKREGDEIFLAVIPFETILL